MPKTPEGELKAQIVEYLLGIGGVVEPLMTGQVRGGVRRYSTPKRSTGRADILWLYEGCAIAIEVKAGTKQRPDQQVWEKLWKLHGGLYWLIDSIEALHMRVNGVFLSPSLP